MLFTARRFRRFLSKKTQRKRKGKGKGKRGTRRKQNGGGNTFSRQIPTAAVIANPGAPPREEQDSTVEGALD